MAAAVQLDRQQYAATLIIHNEMQLNALTPAMLEELDAHLQMLATDASTRAVVLRGAGDAFSSGYAIDRFPDPADLPEEDAIEVVCKRIESAPFVVIAAIEGLCVGAALDLACACDTRYSTRDARLGITPSKLGLIYSWQGMNRVQRVAGRDAARRLFFTAELFRADSPIGSRLVTELADDRESLDQAVANFVSAVTCNAPLSIAGTKWALRLLDGLIALDGDLSREHHRHRQEAMASADCAEGRAAFAERRAPRFTGR